MIFQALKFLNLEILIILNGSKLLINRALLDKVFLKQSFLHNFSKIEYLESSMEGIKIIDFKEVKIVCISNKDTNGQDIDRIDLLRFFKNYSSHQNNKYLYHKYKAAEFNSLTWNCRNKLNLLNRVILILNTISKNHTTNPVLAFFNIVILFFLFSWYLIRNSDNEFFISILVKYPEYFFTPIRFFSSIEDEEPLRQISCLNLVDLGYKIFLSYLIYQLVAALRKFSN